MSPPTCSPPCVKESDGWPPQIRPLSPGGIRPQPQPATAESRRARYAAGFPHFPCTDNVSHMNDSTFTSQAAHIR